MGRQHKWLLHLLLAAAAAAITACDQGAPPAADNAVEASRKADTAVVAEDTAQGGAGEVRPTDRAVVAEMLAYAEVGEQLVYGYFVFPEDMVDPLPGLIVIHERWGLDDGTRKLADRLAAQGYVVLAVDLFGGKTTRDNAGARALMSAVIENPEIANENIRQAYAFLAQSGLAPAIGALGWSFGGSWALNAAMLFPNDLRAAVIYYGQVTSSEEKLAPVNVPILGLFGENDRGITVENVKAFERTLENLGKDYEIDIYPDVGHAFADPEAPNYNAAVAEQAWNRVLAFLDEHLGGTRKQE